MEGGPGGRTTERVPRRRVLLVEDNRNLRLTTSRMLEHLGFAVTAVGSGPEAVRAYGGGDAPDVVILDLVMPGMSGGETLRAIRAVKPGALAVLCSGSPDELIQAERELGPSATLTKPYDVDGLSATLERVLRRS